MPNLHIYNITPNINFILIAPKRQKVDTVHVHVNKQASKFKEITFNVQTKTSQDPSVAVLGEHKQTKPGNKL